MVLNVDPGGYSCEVARLISGLFSGLFWPAEVRCRLRRGFGVMGRQFVRIITGRAHHGEDTTGADFDGHRRTIARTELIVGNLLQLGSMEVSMDAP